MLRTLLLLAALAAPADAGATDWRLLGQQGVLAIIRHANAPGVGDPAGFRLDDCTTQRNLDAAGRAQARAIGAAIRAGGVQSPIVWTSQYCRSRETAELLGLGPVTEQPALNSFFADRARQEAQMLALRALLRTVAPGQTVVLVSHQVNITALTGIFPASGEAILFRLAAGEQMEVVGRIAPPRP